MRSFFSSTGVALTGVLLGLCALVGADEFNHKYKEGDDVTFYVHKVGPYANPQEAYSYYDLPYCAPDNVHHPSNTKSSSTEQIGLFNQLKSTTLAEHLGGHVLRHSGHSIQYASKPFVESCTTAKLTVDEAAQFTKAVENHWFYQMYLDDLPIWGMVGEMQAVKGSKDAVVPHVNTKRQVVIEYNGDRIINVDLDTDPASLKPIEAGKALTFETSFEWKKTDQKFHSRFDRYLDDSFFKHSIHWFSIFNSFMMVLFLSGLVSLILVRTLKKDYARYALSSGDVEEGEDADAKDENGKPLLSGPMTKGGGIPTEESGWRQVHGDVFRAPRMLPVLAAILGSGWQLIVLTLGVILFAVAGPLHGEVHEDRGEIEHAILCCYCLSSIVSGYASGSYFNAYSAKTGVRGKASAANTNSSWQAAMLLTVVLLPTVIVSIILALNSLSFSYGTINYIPFLAIVKLLLVWIFFSVPLCILGTLVGRHTKSGGKGAKCFSNEFPCRVNAIPRPIPYDVMWYGKPSNIIPFAGLLCFGSIFIELYYILTSLWNYKIYHVYGFLLGVYGILTIVVSMSTIIVVYFCLNAENYQWQWISLTAGASTAGYVFLYGVYYFIFKTNMTGFLQTMFYFGYMGLIAIFLGTLCGTIGHFAASRFVRGIFQNVKVD